MEFELSSGKSIAPGKAQKILRVSAMTKFVLTPPDMVQETPELMSLLKKVNSEINRYRYVEDIKQYKTLDHWTAKIEESERGDCDDYTLSKRKRLMESGVPFQCLFPTICYVKGEGHLVLVVRTTNSDYLLDNIEQEVVAIDKVNYEWHARLNPINQTWSFLK